MDRFFEDEGKLGHGFTSADKLEKIDLVDGSKPRLTYISAKLEEEYKKELITLLRNSGIALLGNIMRCLA
jgi:hypothetical protein